MKSIFAAIAVVLLVASASYGAWYVAPAPVATYYAPLYGYPAPVYAYPAPPVVPAPYAVYSPVLAPRPYMTYAPVVAPAPVLVGPPAVVVRSKVFIPGRPVRNVVRAVLP